MRHFFSDRLWDFYSYLYDPITIPLLRKSRQNYIDLLLSSSNNLDNLLIVGVGTGEDLLLIDDKSINITCIDYSDKMLSKAMSKGVGGENVSFMKMDAHNLSFASDSFGAVLLPLIVAVARDPLRCFVEAVRVLKPGGMMLIFDKFLDEGQSAGFFRRSLNIFTDALATSINVDFYDLLSHANLKVLRSESSLLIFKTFLLEKES